MSEIVEGCQEERHVCLTTGGLPDFPAALAWALNRYDENFTGATMVKLEVEQSMESDTAGDQWRCTWSAAVSGTFGTDPKASASA